MKEKRKVSITIDDLDDTKIVFEAIDNLFHTLICHYIDTDFDKLNLFVVSMSVYFGKLLGLLGYREEELK